MSGLVFDWPDSTDGMVFLRTWSTADAPALAAAWSDPRVIAGSSPPAHRTVDAALAWIEGVDLRRSSGAAIDMVVSLVEEPTVVLGEVGLSSIDPDRRSAVMGWWIAADHRGAGFGERAVGLLVDWSLDSGRLDWVMAKISADNVASIRLAGAVGFVEAKSTDDDSAWWVASRGTLSEIDRRTPPRPRRAPGSP